MAQRCEAWTPLLESRMRRTFVVLMTVGISACGTAGTSGSGANTETRSMDYLTCVSQQRAYANQYRAAGASVYDVNLGTSSGKAIRICGGDGSVLVTCSSPDRKMIIHKSSYRCR